MYAIVLLYVMLPKYALSHFQANCIYKKPSIMPSYKLTYFNFTGRAEPCRYLFALAGQKYEDVRLTQEEFQKLKPCKYMAWMVVQCFVKSARKEKRFMFQLIHAQ